MQQRVTAETFEAWNEEMIRNFDPGDYHDRSSLPVRIVERQRVRRIVALVDAYPGARTLEVGCGAGNVLERMPRGAQLFGVDLSPYILEKARTRLGDRATLTQANAEQLPYDDASFDRVFCSEVLEHVIDPAAVVREMRRVLKPTGIAVVSVPNEATINHLKRLLVKTGPVGRWVLQARDGYTAVENMEDHWHLHSFDVPLLRSVCEGPFRVDHVEGVPVPPPLALRLVARLTPV